MLKQKYQHFRTAGIIIRTTIGVLTAAVLMLTLGTESCTEKTAESKPYKDVLIEGVPLVRQKPDFCGEACAEMYLRKLSSDIDQDYIFNQSGVDPALGRGCHTAELAKALEKIGFKPGRVCCTIAADDAGKQMTEQFAALYADLARGIPSIVCMHYDRQPAAAEHFRLVLGYDCQGDEVIYHEPAEADGAYRRIKRERFLRLWPLKYEKEQWTVIRMRLEAGRIEEPEAVVGFTNANYAQHIMQLKKMIPNDSFTMVLQRPFVVVGDETPAMVRRWAVGTIKWTVDKLKQDYFDKDPAEIIDIWLFKDDKSYRKHARQIFGDNPDTPFGYYSSRHRALVMNVATGGGTLVHEIVHPFVASNFPLCPAWFNEGLASLYEQCREKDGHIRGLTNWRLAGLQKKIRARDLPSFKQLTHTTESQFYGATYGDNYAQARYLCYYLQEKGLLVEYYHKFCANREQDPTGYETLKKVLGEEDMVAFQGKWEAFVLSLAFP